MLPLRDPAGQVAVFALLGFVDCVHYPQGGDLLHQRHECGLFLVGRVELRFDDPTSPKLRRTGCRFSICRHCAPPGEGVIVDWEKGAARLRIQRPNSREVIRDGQHWSIENSCHSPTPRLRRSGWVLDTAFREDHNQTYIGHAAKNLGALCRIVLNLLKIDLSNTRSLPKKRRRAMLDLTYRDSLLSLA